MDSIGKYFSANVNEAEAQQMSKDYEDSHREVRECLKKLRSWGEESQREFSSVSIGINNGINNLIEEVWGLRAQLSDTAKERNDLIQTVNILNMEIRKLSSELSIAQSLQKPVYTHNQDSREDMEVAFTDNLDLETSNIRNKSVEQDEHEYDAINSEQVEPDEEVTEDQVEETDQVCPKCKFEFSTNENLRIHLKNIHPELQLIQEIHQRGDYT